MSSFGLDPCWMYSLPGFTILAALKSTKVEIELLTDYDMVLFFERSIRGGFCFASKRYGEANHVGLPSFDSSKPNKYLWYIDANNLYGKDILLLLFQFIFVFKRNISYFLGYAMSQPLPLRDFRWMSEDQLKSMTENNGQAILNIPDDASRGCVLEVDLDYPKHLHKARNDFPLCPETRTIGNDKTPKLIASLESKTRYVVHYTYLKRALKNGLVLKKIHNGIEFANNHLG
jgi:hypothetical protein